MILIPSRGGSKGVPRKNLRPLGGIPLIGHTIRTALELAADPADVVVSTDSEEIAEAARKAGATVPFIRPAELATDTAPTRDVILHALRQMGEKAGEFVILLQPTSPFRNVEDIKKAVEIYEKQRPDMVVSVRPAATNPYYNAYEQEPGGELHISKGDGMFTRRQDAPPVWEFDGSFYVINPDSLALYPSLARMPRILPVENTASPNIDIDTELDFALAELCLRQRR